jgi:hypothetical protein
MHKASVAVIAVLAAIPGGATPVAAFHRQTPPIVRLTSSGDDTLPRAAGPRLTFSVDPSHLDPDGYFAPPRRSPFAPVTVSVLRQNWIPKEIELIENGANPTSSVSAHVIAYEEDCSLFVCSAGDTGRQIFLWLNLNLEQVTHDPTGTSVNPALDGLGDLLAFESQGDLAGTGASGSSQIFLATVGPPGSNPTLTQVTQGSGTSRNAALSLSGATLVFESTNDDQGNDTGVSQIWLATTRLVGAPTAITKGAAPSVSPSISSDGRIVAFASTAAVASDGHDTGVSQIFIYDTRTRAITQLTDDPAGCSQPSVDLPHHDWRVAFVCHGMGFFHLLKRQQRFELPLPDGSDTATVRAMGSRPSFITVSTTADLTGGAPVANQPAGGTTSGHQLYLLNLFKLPAIPVNLTPTASPTSAFDR